MVRPIVKRPGDGKGYLYILNARTGDKNDRAEYFCPLVNNTDMQAANGGGMSGDSCVPPSPAYVDWVTASREVSFTNYQALRTKLVRKITDHPVIVSGASIPPASVVAAMQTVGAPDLWARLVTLMDRPDLAVDPRAQGRRGLPGLGAPDARPRLRREPLRRALAKRSSR